MDFTFMYEASREKEFALFYIADSIIRMYILTSDITPLFQPLE